MRQVGESDLVREKCTYKVIPSISRRIRRGSERTAVAGGSREGAHHDQTGPLFPAAQQVAMGRSPSFSGSSFRRTTLSGFYKKDEKKRWQSVSPPARATFACLRLDVGGTLIQEALIL